MNSWPSCARNTRSSPRCASTGRWASCADRRGNRGRRSERRRRLDQHRLRIGLPLQQRGHHRAQVRGVLGREKAIMPRGTGRRGQRMLVELSRQLARDRNAGIDQRQPIAGDGADRAFQERVVGAAQHQGIGAGVEHRREIGLQALAHGGSVELALFDQRHQSQRRLAQEAAFAVQRCQQPREFRALERIGGRQHAHHLADAGRGGGLQAGFDPDDRHRQALTQQRHGMAGGGIAGDHQRLAALADHPLAGLQRAGFDEVLRFFAVGRVLRVGQVQQRLVRQQGADLAQHRQAAEAGIEDADGCGVHGVGDRRVCSPLPLGGRGAGGEGGSLDEVKAVASACAGAPPPPPPPPPPPSPPPPPLGGGGEGEPRRSQGRRLCLRRPSPPTPLPQAGEGSTACGRLKR
ncbi:hypothetical protein CT19431_60062 [Cupriavidus taiwanensis]|nr:hypothetical protein CT19431_60062 [Cupriavidus taiwanensis]